MAKLGEAIEPIVTKVTDITAGIIDFVTAGDDAGENIEKIMSAVGGIVAVGGLKKIADLTNTFLDLDYASKLSSISTGAAAIAFGFLFDAISRAADVWQYMSGVEQVITILGGLTAAAFTAALAVGAFQSALTIGVAVVAIAAGIGIMMAAIESAENRAKKFQNMNNMPSLSRSSVPRLATGAVIPPNGEFLAVLGDQRHGRNLEAPEGLIRQIVREESGRGGGTLHISPGPGFTRYLKYELEQENVRAGKPLVGGTRR